jgi:DNA-binding transcriptional LysR family regulator
MLNPTRVRVFFEVASRRSFASAADALNYTSPAVSHHITALEHELGATLINRASRPWTLTPAGERLYGHAETALAELAVAEAEISALSAGEIGRVRIGSVASGLRSIVPPAAAAFHVKHPHIELTLAESQPRPIVKDLRAGNLDLGIIVTAHREAPPESPSFKVTTLIEQSLMVAVPAKSRFGRRRSLTLAQLRNQAWLLPSPGRVPEFRGEVDALFHTAGYTPKIALELADDVAGQALIAAGLGIALIPGLAAPPAHPDVTLIPLRPNITRALHAISLAGTLSTPVLTLLEQLQLAAGQVTTRHASD